MELDAARCYQAILSRDRRFDGRFFTGVVTTGVYCRPVCPVVPPKFVNMRFFACAAAAEAAGFRPCKRCRPETAPGTPAWLGSSALVSRGLRLISAGALDDARVDALATRLGVGERQLRRLFAQHLGASPVDIARARRVHFARALIDDTDLPITEVALSAGFTSIRQFNHSVRTTFGQSPTALRQRRRRREAADSGTGIQVRLPYRPPLAWSALLRFLSLRAIPGVEVVDGDAYRRTVEVNGVAGVIEVRPGVGSDLSGNHRNGRRAKIPAHHAPYLVMRVELRRCESLIDVVERVRRIFDLGADPLCIGDHLRHSAVLQPVVDALPGLRVPGAWSPFELGVRAILGQQVTVLGATTLTGRVVQAFGIRMGNAREGLTHLFPHPTTLADADLAPVGLPRARAATIRAFAEAVACGELMLDASQGLEDTVDRLCGIPGMGPWTAHYIAMRALGEPDAFPATDLGLRRALGDDRGPLPAMQLARLAESWRPWRAYAAMYLWVVGTSAAPRREGGLAEEMMAVTHPLVAAV